MTTDPSEHLRGIDWSSPRPFARETPEAGPSVADSTDASADPEQSVDGEVPGGETAAGGSDVTSAPGTTRADRDSWAHSESWRPPVPHHDGARFDAPAGDGEGLADLFGPDPAPDAGPDAPQPGPGLDELFAEEGPADEAASGPGLDELFGDETAPAPVEDGVEHHATERAGSGGGQPSDPGDVARTDLLPTADAPLGADDEALASGDGPPSASESATGTDGPGDASTGAQDAGEAGESAEGEPVATTWTVPGARRRLQLPGHKPSGASPRKSAAREKRRHTIQEGAHPDEVPVAAELPDSHHDDTADLDDAPQDADAAGPGAQEETAPAPRMALAERVARARDASLADIDQGVLRQAAALQETHNRYANIERLYRYVNQVLGLVSANTELHHLNRLELTRDAALDRRQRQAFEEAIAPHMLGSGISISVPAEIPVVFDLAYDEIIGIGPLGELWRNDKVTDILVDSWDRVTVEIDGHLLDTPVRFRDPDHARQVARNLAQKVSDRALSDQSPLVTAELPGARVTFAMGSIVRSGLSISLRKAQPLMGMGRLITLGSLSPDMRDFLAACVVARATLLVSGGTGTGKTTMINALSESIPADERVVTIEDAFELSLVNRHVVSLQTKERASADDEVRITQGDLLVTTLRMRPDRIIVGEIREAEGARVMLQAANTGHDGTMTTIHANSPEAALNERLSDLLRGAKNVPDDVAKREVAMAIDVVVQVTRRQGIRYVSAISAVDRSSVVSDSRSANISPEPIFVGELTLGPDGAPVPVYRRTGAVRPDTDLSVKLADAGFDLSQWGSKL